MKPSILYKVSAPSFPDELREYLFEQGALEEMTNGKLKDITVKYREGGFEAVKDSVEKFEKGVLIYRQTEYALDIKGNSIRTLEALRQKLEKRGRTGPTIYFEDQIKSDEPAAFRVNSLLFKALEEAIEKLDKAQKDSYEILAEFENEVWDQAKGESQQNNDEPLRLKRRAA